MINMEAYYLVCMCISYVLTDKRIKYDKSGIVINISTIGVINCCFTYINIYNCKMCELMLQNGMILICNDNPITK